ncbi:MAG: hypothetical protein QFX35_04680 [Candidatus Verstraetearchaeota archaeon]|nr:hypothetical protein [Candidatus Verstraetearchaeota archaeon]
MSSVVIYEEILTWRLIIALVLGLLAFSVGVVMYVYANEPDKDPMTLVAVPLVAAVGLGTTLSFSRLSIKATLEGMSVGFGRIRTSFKWDQIEDCYIDTASAVRYGGFGIRGGKFEGKRRLVYNITGTPRIVLKLKTDAHGKGYKYDEFVFSTKRPEELMRIIKSQKK